MLLQLHDSEHEHRIHRMNGPGRLLMSTPFDIAITSVSRALCVWEPSETELANIFELRHELDAEPALERYVLHLLNTHLFMCMQHVSHEIIIIICLVIIAWSRVVVAGRCYRVLCVG